MCYFFTTILAILLFWGSALGAGTSLVAKVGPYVLTKQDVERMLESDPQTKEIIKARPDLKPQIENLLIKKWISLSLLAMGAKDEGLDKNPQVKKDIQETVKLVLANYYLKKEFSKIKPTEKELKSYYEDHKKNYTRPERAVIKYIFVPFSQNATRFQREKAFKKALSIRRQLLSGVKFDIIAQKYSSPSQKGNTRGIVTKGDLPADMEKQIFSLKPGEISKPVESKYGYYIVKLEKKIPAYIPPFKEIKTQVKKDYITEKEKEVLQKVLRKLTEKHEVKIYRSL